MKFIHSLAVLVIAIAWGACASPLDVPANRQQDQQDSTAASDSLNVVPMLLDFGVKSLQLQHTALDVFMIRNTARVTADTLTSIALRNGQQGFTVTSPPLPFVLAGNASVNAEVRFTPTSPGVFTDTVCINGSTKNCVAVRAAVVAGCDKEVDFRNTAIGAAKDMRIEIDNKGTEPLTITSISITGTEAADFAIAGVPPLPAQIPPGEEWPLIIRFTPTAKRLSQATLHFEWTGSPGVLSDFCLSGISW